ncbi:uncharacterized protein LOC134825470 [Bolinopsis microptera]|uniref:uncharacterized protein LOC134825470 n=1 Tax=Bolinopsis microptera TaxID=2820187 RepID=UPI00307ADC38
MNSKRKIKAAISGIRDASGDELHSAHDMANQLGIFFESTFVKEDQASIPDPLPGDSAKETIPDLKFNTSEVQDQLRKVNIWKSVGPDDMHPKLLKTLAENKQFADSVTALFQKCYNDGKIPEIWKQANVTALHKKGDKSQASNYRPISLTCVLSKIFERFLRNHILAHVSPMIVNEQHGFLPKRSCVSNLLECMDIIRTVLGPLLFLLFINDLTDGIESFVSLFADDLKLVTSTARHSVAQDDILKLNAWEKEWLLRFNVKDGKCKVLHIGRNNPMHEYFMNGECLPQVKSEKDLGVLTTRNLDWSDHIDKSVKKAKSVIGWIKRSLICRNKFVMLNVYRTLVRPHIEYAVQVWNLPAEHGNWRTIKKIEDVQREFTRIIDGIGILPYDERLRILQLTTLLERRMRGDLIETFKITKGKVDYGQDLFKISRSGTKILKDKRGNQRIRSSVTGLPITGTKYQVRLKKPVQ